MKPKLTIIGAGPGGEDLLTGRARSEIERAERIFATDRIAAGICGINPLVRALPPDEMRAELEAGIDTVALVSGDAGFFSLSKRLAFEHGESYDIEIINGVSSLSYFCGRLGAPYDDVKNVSVHGRSDSLLGAVSYNKRVFVLTGGERDAGSVLEALCGAGLGVVNVSVGEDLSYDNERITVGEARELLGMEFSRLAVMLIENPEPANPSSRLWDEDFLRGNVPMTKDSVRAISISRLAVLPADTVWDIGAGTGAMSVALAREARDGMVYAVEKEPDALALIAQNRVKFGAFNIEAIAEEAPVGLDALPAPDKVFIGGSTGSLRGLLEKISEKARRCAVCINAVTLETLAEATACLDAIGFADVEIECVNIARSRQAGRYRLMTAQNPVYVISARLEHTEDEV